ncbi:MAG: aldo/keto reductase [Bacteroidetes bacterium]|nr:MAG: aldo/keto reductase [Bacteroidota bacterium]
MNTIPEILINNELSMPVLGLGTWEMGGRQSPDTTEDSKWIHAIETAIGLGVKHIDTAAIYAGGHTEHLVAEAIKNFDRSSYFITTKVSGNNLQFGEVIRSAKASRNRLGIDQIDLLLLHWPNPEVPISQTISAINKLLDDKVIRYFGLSNFPVELMHEIAYYTDAPIITNQVEYNLFTRNKASYNDHIESEIIPWCLKNSISITAWRPVMKGDVAQANHPILVALAEKYAKTPFQIALNWLVSKPQMMAIPKMSSEQHIKENIEAVQFKMEESDILTLDSICEKSV